MSDLSRKLCILYGSETGNAQYVAERFWQESKCYRFHGPVKAMDEYDVQNLIDENCVIFICSTTGQGEEPDNMIKFWKFLLRKNLPLDSLCRLKYAVLGLGDSSYVKYNFVAKRLHKRLAQLGARAILPLALADDQHDLGYDSVTEEWKPTLWNKLLEEFPLPSDINIVFNNQIVTEPRWNISINTQINEEVDYKNDFLYFCDTCRLPEDSFLVEVKENNRVTSNTHFQDVRLIKLSTKGQQYAPGDVLYVRPQNSFAQVQEFYKTLESNGVTVDPNTTVKVSAKDTDMPVPTCLQQEYTINKLLTEYFDLSSIPRRNVYSVLAQLTTSDLEKEKLIEFTTPEGQEELYNYCNRPRRNIIEILGDFPHACENLMIPMMFEVFTPIKPRAFSIASSFQANKNEIHILLAVVKYKTKLVKERLGLCSNWLAGLKIGDSIPVWIKSGSFKFPKSLNSPIIMVGPGTGVAPFRNYLCEQELNSDKSSDTLVLFFGCRNQNHDYICKDDFERMKNNEKILLHCAFSRDQDHKIYVQHKIEENGLQVWERLRKPDAYIFVAGNSKNMPQSVREAFVNVCKKHGELDEDQAEHFVQKLEKSGRYQTETWA